MCESENVVTVTRCGGVAEASGAAGAEVCSPLTPMLKQKLSVWIQSDFSAFEGCGSKTCLRLCKPSPMGDPPPASRALIGGAAGGLFTALLLFPAVKHTIRLHFRVSARSLLCNLLLSLTERRFSPNEASDSLTSEKRRRPGFLSESRLSAGLTV